MKIKIKKGKDKKIIETSNLITDLKYTCRKWRIRGYTIIKFIK